MILFVNFKKKQKIIINNIYFYTFLCYDLMLCAEVKLSVKVINKKEKKSFYHACFPRIFLPNLKKDSGISLFPE